MPRIGSDVVGAGRFPTQCCQTSLETCSVQTGGVYVGKSHALRSVPLETEPEPWLLYRRQARCLSVQQLAQRLFRVRCPSEPPRHKQGIVPVLGTTRTLSFGSVPLGPLPLASDTCVNTYKKTVVMVGKATPCICFENISNGIKSASPSLFIIRCLGQQFKN